ncbi:diguanylate cyclase/phosphodiesterase (GGDEF & EAL domains) with PAS/PAC sensor(s) [Nitrincola lacisaponensis]|uniref:Diguanylate cyclase/phosphodiesterase (GGDEF & EAL domains) with PAS/PAC sensor(S) n=1 Tax=Nitrincola lacisaponensis TaxID=267850 RepID=A0A063XYN5_9GAMM|nr:GGDEF domain-containing phosphodiesterase [Nitrincola lacisaponensis]KDE39258.1 diguanylate cyclase/phosphodiesterase (GGDEF & EAL domains) with PAS/PAC sensor(s) [Nitrincola lacisaponensis]
MKELSHSVLDAGWVEETRRMGEQEKIVAEVAGMVTWQYDIDSHHLSWSSGAEYVLGGEKTLPDSMEDFEALVQPDELLDFKEVIRRAVIRGHNFSVQVGLLNGKGQRVLMSGRLDSSGGVLLGVLQDIALLNLSYSQIREVGQDELTGLATRKAFCASLKRWSPRVTSHTSATFVMLIQVQRLHHISSVLDPEQVDRLLVRVAGYLDTMVAEDGLAARFHGGLFAIWDTLQGDVDAQRLELNLRERLTCLEGVWEIGGQEILLSFKVGVSYSFQPDFDEQTLIKQAQLALYAVVPSEQINVTVFDARLAQSPRLQLSLDAELKKAVEHQQFCLLYQPQMDIRDQQIVGAEALLRWQRSENELIAPGAFMSTLESSGLIRPLGEWIMQEALRQQASWAQQGVCLQMGINVSPVQLEQGKILDQLERMVADAGCDRSSVCIEITESLAIKKPLMVAKTLSSIREAGYKVALDDFGIGFSSLEYLLRFSFDILKIDRAFIWNLAQGSKEQAIVRALAPLCQSLGLKTVAEGVETRQQYDLLSSIGVDQVQGYMLSRPVTADAVTELISDFRGL